MANYTHSQHLTLSSCDIFSGKLAEIKTDFKLQLDVCDVAPLKYEYLLLCKLISLLMCIQHIRQGIVMFSSPTQAVIFGIFFHQYIIILATRVWL